MRSPLNTVYLGLLPLVLANICPTPPCTIIRTEVQTKTYTQSLGKGFSTITKTLQPTSTVQTGVVDFEVMAQTSVPAHVSSAIVSAVSSASSAAAA